MKNSNDTIGNRTRDLPAATPRAPISYRSGIILLLAKYDSEERGVVQTGFWWEESEGVKHLEDLGVDAKIILIWILKRWNRSMNWIDLT